MKAEIKSLEGNCNSIQTQITYKKENEDRESKVLKWLSSYDSRRSYEDVLERTKVKGRYSTRCEWVVEHPKFKEWYAPGTNSVLWLTGTIGIGKTTLMARAIREMQGLTMIEVDAMPLAIFFFQKACGSSTSLLSVETCLRSLVRQLSWNKSTAQVGLPADKIYNDFQYQQTVTAI